MLGAVIGDITGSTYDFDPVSKSKSRKGCSMKAVLLVIIIYFLLGSQVLLADCVWQWDCSTTPCQHVPICDNSYEMVPMEPVEMAPMPPMKSMQPMESTSMNPIGTSDCEQKYVCNDDNECDWEEVCE